MTLSAHPTDHDLLRAWADGVDPGAFAALVDRHAGMVLATCRRVAGATVAEDATQEVFLGLARQARRIRGPVPAWLHAVAVRVATRWRRRRPGDAAFDDREEPATDDRQALLDLRLTIDEALGRLPDEERACVVLTVLEGCSQEETARRTGLSQPTVSRRVAAGLARLRQDLGGSLGAVAVAPVVSPDLLAGCKRFAVTAPAAAAGGGALIATGAAVVALLVGALAVAGWRSDPEPRQGDPPAAEVPDAFTGDRIVIPDRVATLGRWAWFLTAPPHAATPAWVVVTDALAEDQLPGGWIGERDRDDHLALAASAGYRVRRAGPVVVVDRAADPALDLAWARAGDEAALEAAAVALAASTDADRLRPLLVDLADGGMRGLVALDALAPLAVPGVRPVDWERSASPLALFRNDPGVHGPVVMALVSATTPADRVILAGLAGLTGATAAGPVLDRMARDGRTLAERIAGVVARARAGLPEPAGPWPDADRELTALRLSGFEAGPLPGAETRAHALVRSASAAHAEAAVEWLRERHRPMPDDLSRMRLNTTDADLFRALHRWARSQGVPLPGTPDELRRILHDPDEDPQRALAAAAALAPVAGSSDVEGILVAVGDAIIPEVTRSEGDTTDFATIWVALRDRDPGARATAVEWLASLGRTDRALGVLSQTPGVDRIIRSSWA
jgi:RNA polymerase sigma factor (sigma-70 family)